jgi:hypothetical protein
VIGAVEENVAGDVDVEVVACVDLQRRLDVQVARSGDELLYSTFVLRQLIPRSIDAIHTRAPQKASRSGSPILIALSTSDSSFCHNAKA